jgi:signal transduction histidine kinase
VAERRLRSVRARATLGAVVVVLVALVVGAVAFHAVLSSTLAGTAGDAAETRLHEIEQRLDDGGADVIRDLDDDVVQLLDADGRVTATTEDAAGETLPAADGPTTVDVDGDRYVVVGDDLDEGRLVVGVPYDDQEEALATVALLLVVAVPLLAALVGLVTWIVVGRALAPVERIRAEVDGITGDRLDRRVPVPDSGDEVAGLAATMNGMLERLDASARAQRRFVSDASHELRSPLATIRQHAELARSHPDALSVTELADTVHDEGLRLQGLVDALLVLARLDEGAPVAHDAVDLDDLVLAEASRLRGAGMTVDASGIGPARVGGDPRLLGRVTRNLADNARRHAAGRVAFTLAERGDEVRLSVEDDGAGIPEAERERVFDRFVRLDEARARDAGGSGLGLAIVRAVVEASGGRITVGESRWGGARFDVVLPAGS